MGLRSGSITGSITFGGIASGFPTNEIIDQVLELEQRPIDLLEGQKTDFEEKLAILQDLNTKTLSFRNALRDLDNMTNVRASTSPSARDRINISSRDRSSALGRTPTLAWLPSAMGSNRIARFNEVSIPGLPRRYWHRPSRAWAQACFG